VTFIERSSRYWIEARAGLKTTELFTKATKTAWQWARMSQYIQWFTDGALCPTTVANGKCLPQI
jgi:hypothetical protein